MARLRTLVFSSALVLACAALVALSLYTLILDQQVRSRFSGARWSLPAQIYASPFELYPGRSLTVEQLVAELQRLGYRRDGQSQGSYRVNRQRIELKTRPFAFTDGAQPAADLVLEFSDGRLSRLSDAATGQSQSLLRLDPLLIGSIYPQHGEDRVLVRLDQTPQLLRDGLIQTEDQRFYQHWGLDPRAIARAALVNLRAGSVVQGGSTLTQQLVKNFFLHNTRSFSRKFSEAILSLLLEWHYSKAEILEAYLNEVYLGQDGQRAVHGFGLASVFYFRKPLAELEPAELALLVGMVKGPSYYNPRRHPERARERRNLVLGQWAEAGLLAQPALSLARGQALGVGERGQAANSRYPAFVEQVHRDLARDYANDALTEEGLRIFTSLDPGVQSAAEDAIENGVGRLSSAKGRDGLQGAAVVASVTDGSILGIVGGRNTVPGGFNRALDAQRPIGSTIKPVVYLTALDQSRRYQLTSTVADAPVRLSLPNGTVWTPQNFDETLHGDVPLYRALVRSYNLATVNLGLELGVERVVATLKRLGVEDPVPALPSLLLGAWERSPLQLTQIYAALASAGFAQRLTTIRAVQTRDGDLLKRYPIQLGKPLDADVSFLLGWALQQVTQQGTGRGIYQSIDPSQRIAGKTGTSDGLRDSWFAGFGDNLLGVVWVGHDDNRSTGLTGASGALPIWAQMMAQAGIQGLREQNPGGIEWVRVDSETHLPAPKGCRSVLRIPFIRGTVPSETAPCAPTGVFDRFLDLWR